MDLIRHLRYFVAVAEQCHFGRAADTLGVTQPPVSQGVRRLEQTLGLQLFERKPTGVVLTDHGASLLSRARLVVGDTDRLLEEAARLSGPPRQLRIGFTTAIDDCLLSACVTAVRESMTDPHLPIFTATGSTVDLADRLRLRELDVAVVEHPALLDEIQASPTVRIPRWFLLPSEHRAARAAAPHIQMLSGLCFATPPRAHNPPSHDQLIDRLRARGLDPAIMAAPSLRDVISAVLSGQCFGLTTGQSPNLAGIARRRMIRKESSLTVRVATADVNRFQRPVDILDRVLRSANR
ncbi:LysR family transcriptional regulator [Mycobacterium haemophilum DSM 44634]|uniref:LysR family transcriptional regulator n=1 Tax=Mycobacterium haemophilum TaxID=29311 RepID=UPI0006559547|nr:LysR family transcriptional regulator [Mycobacterium haemophilum]AKN16118.1 hypothetical protein B586_05325 [Mycobacterium haemophilum DSM 44634]MCV7339939.1 LysR family transcriptional regulator [Mycobacterium haemophilum DSM 44634]